MRSYPIWNKVTACIYNSAKSFGAENTSEIEVLVGTSSKSHCTIITTKREQIHPRFGNCTVFQTSLDGVILKQSWFTMKNGKISEMVKQVTKLKSIKSL